MCRRMCRLASMLLSHTDKSAFYTSPWFADQTPFLVYRGLAAIFTFLVLQGNMVVLNITSNFGWFLKFTHWGFVALTAHMCVSAAICLREHVKVGRDGHDDFFDDSARLEDDDFHRNGPKMEQESLSRQLSSKSRHHEQSRNTGPLPWYMKLDWALYNIACTHALTISTVYYSAMGGDLSTNSWLLHIMNSVLVVTEVLICDIPSRIAHVIYPELYLVTYVLFVCWVSSLDGFRKYSQVYVFLDFAGKTKRTAYLVVVMIVFVVPAFHAIVYVLYRCRLALLRMVHGGGLKAEPNIGQKDAQTQTEPLVELATV
ncbi:PREDICTED: protein rolling stone-like [Branchiostoma belcheri]|uniref:Protein rolling stone-like n=1 Tax=Branchiostoma belcheri TaxID=7741 RepID=A0A6P4YV39_BRABE|nr:PREDICTED: protein rolling stone-like [Branchiostoma belcheri]